MKTLLEKQLLAAIKESGLTAYRISKSTDVQISAVARFMNGERTITLHTAGKIADCLGFELTAKGK